MGEPGLALMEIDDFSQFEGRIWLEFWNGPYKETARAAMDDARAGRYSQFQGSAIGLPIGAVRLPDLLKICSSPLLARRSEPLPIGGAPLAHELSTFLGVCVGTLSSRRLLTAAL
jgi:hypothetical protein